MEVQIELSEDCYCNLSVPVPNEQSLTLLPTAFYDFLSYGGGGGGFLSHTPENNVKIIWLIWNLVHTINGIRLLRMQNFIKFAVLFLEILRHEVDLFTRERLIAFRCLPPEFVFNDAQNHSFIIKNGFSNLKLYFLHISVIFNKKKNFHVSNFPPVTSGLNNDCSNPLGDRFC